MLGQSAKLARQNVELGMDMFEILIETSMRFSQFATALLMMTVYLANHLKLEYLQHGNED